RARAKRARTRSLAAAASRENRGRSPRICRKAAASAGGPLPTTRPPPSDDTSSPQPVSAQTTTALPHRTPSIAPSPTAARRLRRREAERLGARGVSHEIGGDESLHALAPGHEPHEARARAETELVDEATQRGASPHVVARDHQTRGRTIDEGERTYQLV